MSENVQYYEVEEKSNGVAIAALVCGLISFFGCCNPLYLVSLAAVVLGIVGMTKKNCSTGMSVAGLVLGCLGALIWVVVDIITIPFTMGLGFLI